MLKGEITAKEMGQRGMATVRNRYPKEERLKWSEKGGRATKDRYGADHYRAIQLKGAATKRRKRMEKEQNQPQVDILTTQ